MKISDESPRVYLVAPTLRFHPSFQTMARAIAPDIEIYRFDINEDWRAGVRVMRRTRVNYRNWSFPGRFTTHTTVRIPSVTVLVTVLLTTLRMQAYKRLANDRVDNTLALTSAFFRQENWA